MLCIGVVYGRDLSRAWLMKGWMKLGAVALLSWRWLALLTIGAAAETEVGRECKMLDCLEWRPFAMR